MVHPVPAYLYVLEGTPTVEFERGSRAAFQAFLSDRLSGGHLHVADKTPYGARNWYGTTALVCCRAHASVPPTSQQQSLSVRVILTASEIQAFVERGYLHPDNRNDSRAIGYAAMAFISDSLFGT
jgi:hypothetical protein